MAQLADTAYELWHRAGKRDAGRTCVDTINRLADKQRWRRTLTRLRLSTYLGRPVHRLGSDLYEASRKAALSSDPDVSPESISFAESIVDTAVAKIFAKQKPKGQVVTKGGDWRERNQAKLYSKFLEGLLYDNQGTYENTWELAQMAAADGARFAESGVIKVYPDEAAGRVVHDRCFAFDMFTDPIDSRFGNPRSLHHRYLCDKAHLIDRFPSHERAIMSAALHDDDREMTDHGYDIGMCSVYESWRLGPKGGRHIIAVDGQGDNALVDEEYKRDYFPFAFYHWKRSPMGFWGIPLVDQCIMPQAQANEILGYILENLQANAHGYLDAPRGVYDESELESNIAMKVMYRDAGHPPSINVEMPPIYNEQTRAIYELMRGLSYELTGVSEMASQGRKETSISSGVAIRTVNDMQSERFLPQARRYEQMFVTIARLDIDAVQDLAEKGEKISTVVPDEGFLEQIDWDEIDLEEDRFSVIVAPSSANADTIAARMQTVQEFVEAGWIRPEVAQEALASGNADVEHLSKRATAQRRYIDKLAGKFARFDPEKDEWGDVFEPPYPLLNIPAAIMQMTDLWIEMLADEHPAEQLDMALEWIKRADAMEAEKEAPPAPAGPPGGQPMMPPEGMAPPGAMGSPPMAPPAAEGMPPPGVAPPVAA